MRWLEHLFETLLWRSRAVVLLAVVASLLSAFAMFYLATVDAVYMLTHLAHYAEPSLDPLARQDLHSATVAHVVEIVDGYLLGAVLLIFALGLYELFISKLEIAKGSETSNNVLLIDSLDDLKSLSSSSTSSTCTSARRSISCTWRPGSRSSVSPCT